MEAVFPIEPEEGVSHRLVGGATSCPRFNQPQHTAVSFRPGALTVSGRGSDRVCVQVPPVPLQRILVAPPDKLHRCSGEGRTVTSLLPVEEPQLSVRSRGQVKLRVPVPSSRGRM